WKEKDQIQQMVDLVDSGQIEQLTDEELTIDGKKSSYYVVKIIPDLKVLAQQTMQSQMNDLSSLGASIEDMIKQYSAIVYINKKTFVIERSVVDMEMVFTPPVEDEMGALIGEMTIDMTLVADMYDINEPVEITLPAGASNAADASSLGTI
ncbi:DUF6612 family protein, partial [Nanoarchaeota archaeon]